MRRCCVNADKLTTIIPGSKLAVAALMADARAALRVLDGEHGNAALEGSSAPRLARFGVGKIRTIKPRDQTPNGQYSVHTTITRLPYGKDLHD